MDGFPVAMALLGLASGVHCVGMCGGIVTAFSVRPVIPLRPAAPQWPRQLAFNLGGRRPQRHSTHPLPIGENP